MIPTTIKQKYLNRLDELIERANKISVEIKTVNNTNPFTGNSSQEQVTNINWQQFVEWRTNCTTVLDNIVPNNSIHRSELENFNQLPKTKSHFEYGISFLKSIREDFEKEFFDSLYHKIETEICADYMEQAQTLINVGKTGKFEHVPAAVLAGAVLEKSLKSLCKSQFPPEPIINNHGRPLMLNALIESLKKRNVFNEIVAKQLRAWTDIRNKAAHGEFEDFNKFDVENMIRGIESFLLLHS